MPTGKGALVSRRLQFGSGVALFAYIALHLLNHAVALWSLDAAGAVLSVAISVWHSLPGTAMLYGAAALHFSLALRSLYTRRSWTMTPAEWLRLFAGLSLPLLLIRHAVGTRLAASLYGFEPDYGKVVVSLLTSGTQGWQIALLAPGWLHGCLGLWFRIRRCEPARRAWPVFVALMVMLPVLSAAGFLRMLDIERTTFGVLPAVDPALALHRPSLESWRRGLDIGYVCVVFLSIVAGHVRNAIEARNLGIRSAARPAPRDVDRKQTGRPTVLWTRASGDFGRRHRHVNFSGRVRDRTRLE